LTALCIISMPVLEWQDIKNPPVMPSTTLAAGASGRLCTTGMASPATLAPCTTTYSVICFLPSVLSSSPPSRHLVCCCAHVYPEEPWIRNSLHTHFWTVAELMFSEGHVRSLQAPGSTRHGSALTSSSCALTIVLCLHATVPCSLSPFLSAHHAVVLGI